jgi:hypothetical protein
MSLRNGGVTDGTVQRWTSSGCLYGERRVYNWAAGPSAVTNKEPGNFWDQPTVRLPNYKKCMMIVRSVVWPLKCPV